VVRAIGAPRHKAHQIVCRDDVLILHILRVHFDANGKQVERYAKAFNPEWNSWSMQLQRQSDLAARGREW
jgi:hypothetical protein